MANPTPPSNTALNSSTLQTIQTKVRRITRSPSENQLSTAELNKYINTFVIYDFPEQLRTFNLRTSFSFFTNPGQDVYNTDITSFAGATDNLLYNFQNKYLTVHPPFYVAGFQSFSSQSPEQFYGIYPKVNNISSIGVKGNGSAGPFTGFINSQQAVLPSGIQQQIGLLQGQVLFSATGTPGTGEIIGMGMADVPVVDAATGVKLNIGNLYDVNGAAYQAALKTPPTLVNANNNINYLTGAYVVNFPAVTFAGTPITSQSVPSIWSLPQAVLYYSNKFTIRPVPDQVYTVNFEVYQRPTELLTGNSPELEEYWQYIAYGTSLKIFQDRLDNDSAQQIMPELNNQLKLCLRRTLVQYTNERTATIYTEQVNFGGSGGNGWGNGGAF